MGTSKEAVWNRIAAVVVTVRMGKAPTKRGRRTATKKGGRTRVEAGWMVTTIAISQRGKLLR